MAETEMTLRQMEDYTGVPRSTIHSTIVKWLPEIDSEVASQARAILFRHRWWLSTLGPDQKVFLLGVVMKGEQAVVCVAAGDAQEAIQVVNDSKMTVRREKMIVEFPHCDKMRINCQGTFFCGDGDENGPMACLLGAEGESPAYCSGACRKFRTLIGDPKNGEVMDLPAGYRMKRLKPEIVEKYNQVAQ